MRSAPVCSRCVSVVECEHICVSMSVVAVETLFARAFDRRKFAASSPEP